VLANGSVTRLVSAFEDELLKSVTRLTPRIVLLEEAEEVLARVVCAWAGVELDEERRVRDIVAMIEGSGGAGPRNWRGRVGRARAEWWVERQIEDARKADISPATALGLFARSHLDAHTAAVELLNIIRPTIAVARYIVFAAHALHEYPHAAEPLRDEAYLEPFVHEVRRFYPFFPAAVARVRRTFTWHKVEFHDGERVMLDLYGTNHDPALWPEPEEFRPQRFVGWQVNPYTLIPQGGGDIATGHRCPGERLTIELMKAALRVLTRRITYEVPPQDLSISLTRIPALPASRFVMTNVRWNGG
jgi:fatty-acid peroxygenase